MKEAKRNAPAANYCTTGEKPWPLTPNQWLVYYWLLAHSKWNYGQREDHYFIYDNSYKKKTIQKDCGIKSDKTVASAFKKLEEVGAIYRLEEQKAYWIFYSTVYTPIDVRIIKFFLAFNKHLNSAAMIELYCVLRRIKVYDNEPYEFTISVLAKLMNKLRWNSDKQEVWLMLSIFKNAGLVEITEHPYVNNMGVECVKYILKNIADSGEGLKNYFVEDEIDIEEQQLTNLISCAKLMI